MSLIVSENSINANLPLGIRFIRKEGFRLIVEIGIPLSIAAKGHMLLELEKRLRQLIDPQIEVMLEPKMDLNKLRARLRGVKDVG